jgi:DGQHR domain-containing protein
VSSEHAPGFLLQKSPAIWVTALPGLWLIEHSTPKWRIKDPKKGFQRMVRDDRATEIAFNVLDQHRTFPNAIVLATDVSSLVFKKGVLTFPSSIEFFVVDGQHRLWSQTFSQFEAKYACVIHLGLSESEMAEIFLEINDNQKRVPSSLRWDLFRLVRSDEDPYALRAVDLIWELNKDSTGPLYQRVDLTGEQHEIHLKQGSLAPEIKTLASTVLETLDFSEQYDILTKYFVAIRDLDADGWREARGPFYANRVIRVLLRLLPDLVIHSQKAPAKITSKEYAAVLSRINPESLAPAAIRAKQGSAGMKDLFDMLKKQIRI